MTPEDRAIFIWQSVFKATDGTIAQHYEDGDAFWLPIAKQIHDAVKDESRKLGNLTAAFRSNMLRATWPEGFDVNAEIDRVLAEIEK